jgi:transposase
VRLWFQDEARFGRISDLRRCWAPPAQRPVVGHQIVRQYLYAMGAVDPWRGRLSSLIMPWVDTETMSIFLTHVAAQQGRECGVMLLDGAGWHRAHALRVPDNLRLITLPPYSPELNPVEHVWDWLRENAMGNQVFADLDAVEDCLAGGLKRLSSQPETLRSLTLFDWLNTLRLTSN